MQPTQTLATPGWNIVYYSASDTFEAQCQHHSGERCTWTKTPVGSGAAGSADLHPPSKRIALLATWLELGNGCTGKVDHKKQEFLDLINADESNVWSNHGRGCVLALLGGPELLALER